MIQLIPNEREQFIAMLSRANRAHTVLDSEFPGHHQVDFVVDAEVVGTTGAYHVTASFNDRGELTDIYFDYAY